MNELQEFIISQKEKLKEQLLPQELDFGEIVFNQGQCQVLSQSPIGYELVVSDEVEDYTAEYALDIEIDGNIIPRINKERPGWDRYSYACLLQVESEMYLPIPKGQGAHIKYTREGMVKRVLKERRQKAEKAEYRIQWADNIYGDHILTNENGVKYKVFLRDFEKETGYSNSMDSRRNKLGTTKHIMFAFKALKENKSLFKRLDKTYPFVEVFCDPLNENKVTWYYPNTMTMKDQLLISRYFKTSTFVEDDQLMSLLGFIRDSGEHPTIFIRPEVAEKVEAAFEKQMLENLAIEHTPDFSGINATLYDYQKEGISFALFRKVAIIADEMGLGKTIQAITTAVLKKDVFGFTKTLVVCPASLKEQWKKEIEKFTEEKAIVVSGSPAERALQYKDSSNFFFIVNYETVLRDQIVMNEAEIDFLILDEAQRAKNYETKTAASLGRLQAKHKLAITGTPIENRLIDIFSIMGILKPDFFGPLWEFSYQHCLFDPEKPNKINGYYNLKKLNKSLEDVLIRREKRNVLDQLPNVRQIDIPINLSPLQSDYHASYSMGLAKIVRKKFLTPFDLQRMQLLLANMRMVCDSTYLVDEKTNESPKLEELKYILLEKLDIKNKDAKIIIFSEWLKVHKLIGKLLRENGVGFVELNGKVPVKSRDGLIRKFESNNQYKVFLSTEAGGSGLNLQVADTLINFELPWNPAKKNQRIGRIDRLGQKNSNLTIYNLVTRNSIEQQIALGLLVKQSLFDGVLGDNHSTDFVDFSTKGRSQFIEQIEAFLNQTQETGETEEQENTAVQSEYVHDEGRDEFTNVEGNNVGEPNLMEDDVWDESIENIEGGTVTEQPSKTHEIETVMNSGMDFLAGLYKMSTGKDMNAESRKIEINPETGEVTMKFKLPI